MTTAEVDSSGLGPTIDGLLELQAASRPTHVFLRFGDGDVTFEAALRRVRELAAGFHDLGLGAGDVVPLLVPNSAEFVLSWLALSRLGAVTCPVNTALRGDALRHVVRVADPRVIVVHHTLQDPVSAVADAMPRLTTVVDVGEPTGRAGHAAFDALADSDADVPLAGHNVRDAAMILFTSGTTGPSKGCVLSHRYVVRQAALMAEHFRFRSDDVLYCPFPLFHIDATVLTVGPALVLGCTAAIGERFSVSGFWPEVRRFGATVFDFMGATLTMLHKQPPHADDADNNVRLAWGVPMPDFAVDFEARFGLQLAELYGSTDAGVPIYQPLDEPRRAGSCGRVIEPYDVRIVDGEGVEVPHGSTGEMVVRPNEPSLMADGYFAMPAATVASRRDLWFHTGDLARRDLDGYFYFVGRMSDSIRRRGENISAFEVEEVVTRHPAVLDAAAFGVPSELTEDDVMVAVVLRPGSELLAADLIAFCDERMARHMVPRYVDFVGELPRTPTEKVRKDVLRAGGITATTWDRERR